jgi:type IV pilus assembly protein PilA
MKFFKKNGQKGFTLIELLIVVAILGILAAVIIPNVTTFMATGKLNALRTEAENIKTAALAYYADYSDWPDTSANLLPAGNPGSESYLSGAGTLNATYTWTGDNISSVSGAPAGFAWIPAKQTWDKN